MSPIKLVVAAFDLAALVARMKNHKNEELQNLDTEHVPISCIYKYVL
jgi:hypothetical protein